MPLSAIAVAELMKITGNQFGEHHATCPLCSEERTLANRKKRVLKVWYERPDFVTYCCQHCGVTGYAHGDSPFAKRIDPQQRALLMRKAENAKLEHVNRRSRTARYLYSCSIPIQVRPANAICTTSAASPVVHCLLHCASCCHATSIRRQ